MAVRQLALYYVEEETPERLVLRAKKLGAYLGAMFLFLGGGMLAIPIWRAFVHKLSFSQAFFLVAEGLGLLILFAGVLLLWHGIINTDRTVFDGPAAEVRFEHADWIDDRIFGYRLQQAEENPRELFSYKFIRSNASQSDIS